MVTIDRRVTVLRDLVSAAERERRCQVRFLECLAEFDAQEWFTFEACSSTFAFLTRRLGYCNHAAWRRLATARAVRRFPVILELLGRGDLHMTGVAMASKWLDDSRGEELLHAMVGKSKREIEVILADLNPQPVGEDAVRSTSPGGSVGRSTPLGNGNWKVEFFADEKLKALIDQAMELTSLGMSLADVVERALLDWVKRTKVRKFWASVAIGEDSADIACDGPRSRHIPAGVRRAVYVRDGGQCAFVDESGRRCSERRGLEFDHLEPFCLGGAHSASNLRMVCSAHNRHGAREVLGRGFMGQWYVGGGQSSRSRTGSR